MNDELERLMREATPGPWFIAVNANTVGDCTPEDAALIVAAVNALPELLAEVRRLEADLQVIAFGWRYVAEPDNSLTKSDLTRDQLIEYARAALQETKR